MTILTEQSVPLSLLVSMLKGTDYFISNLAQYSSYQGKITLELQSILCHKGHSQEPEMWSLLAVAISIQLKLQW